MPNVICEICGRCECVDPWTICGKCYESRSKSRSAEDKTRREMRRENQRLIGSSTPGMDGRTAVHERRGRKLVRPLEQPGFEEQESEDELE